jgi:hypothetical protein
LGKSFLKNMEIGKYFFGKKHGKLTHGQNLAPKIFPGNDSTYPVTRVGSVSFHMPSSGILELNDVLYVPSLTNSLLSGSCMIGLQCMVEFYD